MSLWRDPKNHQWYSRHWVVDDGVVIRYANVNNPARKRRCWLVYGESAKDRERADERIGGLIQKETPEARLELSNKQIRGAVKQSVSAQRVTLSEFVKMLKEGIPGMLRPWRERLAKRTVSGYTQYLRLYILPAFEKLALTEITWDKTLDLLQKLEVDDSLGHHTLTHVRACISTVLTDAVTVRLLKQNPLLGQRRKASRKHRAETIQPKRPLNWAQKAKFEATIDKLIATGWRLRPSYAVHHLLQLHCGLRPSESAALKVSDIDLEKSRLRIERALDEDGTIKATKTHEQRWVDLNTWIKDRLKLHVTWLKAEAIAAGKSGEWLLPSEAWTFLNERNARRAFDAICDEANKSDDGIKLEGHSPYDLRHTFASLQLSAGADPAYVSAQMGHANTEITLTVYTKWVRTEGRRFVDLLAEQDSTGIADRYSPVMTPPAARKPLK